MNIQLLRASNLDFNLIKNLVPYYVYDISEYMGWDCDAEGRWDGCDELPEYWEKPDHHPYVIRADNRVAGFVLIRPVVGEPDTNEISDFFVARKFKGNGVGRASAILALDKYPGKWLVRVLNGNRGAKVFWTKVLNDYTEGAVIQAAERYKDPISGEWDMQYYRFDRGETG